MNLQVAIEQLLGTENLTDNLDDAAADALLNWGIERLRDVWLPTDDEATANAKIALITAIMRGVNHEIIDQAAQAALLRLLLTAPDQAAPDAATDQAAPSA